MVQCQVKPEVQKDGSPLDITKRSLMLSAEILDCAFPSLVPAGWKSCTALYEQHEWYGPKYPCSIPQPYLELVTSTHLNLIFTARVLGPWNQFLLKTSYHLLKTSGQYCCFVLNFGWLSQVYFEWKFWPNFYLCSLLGIDLWNPSLIVLGTVFLWICHFCLLHAIISPA